LQLAHAGARCDYALYLGASTDNYGVISDLASSAAGLKMYLNETFTTLTLKDLTVWSKVRYTLISKVQMKLEVLTPVKMSLLVIWVVTLCALYVDANVSGNILPLSSELNSTLCYNP
jgi:hypothetical protein